MVEDIFSDEELNHVSDKTVDVDLEAEDQVEPVLEINKVSKQISDGNCNIGKDFNIIDFYWNSISPERLNHAEENIEKNQSDGNNGVMK